jgi:hypothetical protein
MACPRWRSDVACHGGFGKTMRILLSPIIIINIYKVGIRMVALLVRKYQIEQVVLHNRNRGSSRYCEIVSPRRRSSPTTSQDLPPLPRRPRLRCSPLELCLGDHPPHLDLHRRRCETLDPGSAVIRASAWVGSSVACLASIY